MARLLDRTSKETLTAMKRVAEACAKHKLVAGAFGGTADGIKAYKAIGYQFMAAAVDVDMMRAGALALDAELEIGLTAGMEQRAPLLEGFEPILDRLVDICLAAGPIPAQTDKYFTNTSRIVAANGDTEVTFAVFMRRRVVAALEPTIRMIKKLVPEACIRRFYQEGDIVPSESKIMEITGPLAKLSECETVFLQKTGFPCVSANNAYEMCRAIPEAGFMDMHARHASGAEMNILALTGPQ